MGLVGCIDQSWSAFPEVRSINLAVQPQILRLTTPNLPPREQDRPFEGSEISSAVLVIRPNLSYIDIRPFRSYICDPVLKLLEIGNLKRNCLRLLVKCFSFAGHPKRANGQTKRSETAKDARSSRLTLGGGREDLQTTAGWDAGSLHYRVLARCIQPSLWPGNGSRRPSEARVF